MIIWQRNEDQKVSRARREEKILIVLEWLSEFRASNVSILARRLQISLANCHKLLADMKEDGLVLSFENLHTRGLRLFALGRPGVQRLTVWGRDTENSVVKAHNLARSTTILHDLCVQRIAIEIMDRYACSEVQWDHNIITDSRIRPDAIFIRPDGFRAALEFDRTAKSPKHFYERLSANYESIQAGHYHAAITASESDAVLHRYQDLYSAPEWPIVRKDSSGNLVTLTSTINPLAHIKREITWLPAKDIVSDIFSSRLRPEPKTTSEGQKTLALHAQ